MTETRWLSFALAIGGVLLCSVRTSRRSSSAAYLAEEPPRFRRHA
jgi:hypothetical protein